MLSVCHVRLQHAAHMTVKRARLCMCMYGQCLLNRTVSACVCKRFPVLYKWIWGKRDLFVRVSLLMDASHKTSTIRDHSSSFLPLLTPPLHHILFPKPNTPSSSAPPPSPSFFFPSLLALVARGVTVNFMLPHVVSVPSQLRGRLAVFNKKKVLRDAKWQSFRSRCFFPFVLPSYTSFLTLNTIHYAWGWSVRRSLKATSLYLKAFITAAAHSLLSLTISHFQVLPQTLSVCHAVCTTSLLHFSNSLYQNSALVINLGILSLESIGEPVCPPHLGVLATGLTAIIHTYNIRHNVDWQQKRYFAASLANVRITMWAVP